MKEDEEDGMGSRCIWCGQYFLAHLADWCTSEEDAEELLNKVIPFPKKKENE